jgi:hypothetical protein
LTLPKTERERRKSLRKPLVMMGVICRGCGSSSSNYYVDCRGTVRHECGERQSKRRRKPMRVWDSRPKVATKGARVSF